MLRVSIVSFARFQLFFVPCSEVWGFQLSFPQKGLLSLAQRFGNWGSFLRKVYCPLFRGLAIGVLSSERFIVPCSEVWQLGGAERFIVPEVWFIFPCSEVWGSSVPSSSFLRRSLCMRNYPTLIATVQYRHI